MTWSLERIDSSQDYRSAMHVMWSSALRGNQIMCAVKIESRCLNVRQTLLSIVWGEASERTMQGSLQPHQIPMVRKYLGTTPRMMLVDICTMTAVSHEIQLMLHGDTCPFPRHFQHSSMNLASRQTHFRIAATYSPLMVGTVDALHSRDITTISSFRAVRSSMRRIKCAIAEYDKRVQGDVAES
ncbi:hypothetical protein IQ06DRAFT_138962 [Phaeosphaeriaceae sp. SRC1lsM3a]|nr:hypothetical protein IQ06DRAFT_138962 [Stagonospora sp. SRC1lsM3a]